MTKFTRCHALVNLSVDGNLICFCPYEEYLQGLCECRERFDCPESIIEITVLPNSRPSDQEARKIRKATREVKKVDK